MIPLDLIFDVIIAGGGLAGSALAFVLASAGIRVALVDQHERYPPIFGADKLAIEQLELLKRVGLFEHFREKATVARSVLNAQHGKVLNRVTVENYGMHYHDMVKTVRAIVPSSIAFFFTHVTAMETSDEVQQVTLTDGQMLRGRLVVLATGINDVLYRKLGIRRQIHQNNHSLNIGFDLQTQALPAASLTYYGERVQDRIDFITIFPIGDVLRANLFTYRAPTDPWVRDFRADPQGALFAALPGLKRFMSGFSLAGPLQIRTIDLYTVEDHVRPGIVLIGDASQTSCPAFGSGVTRLLTDVDRLAHVHLPRWLETPGMGAEKIATFYDDPVKKAYDEVAAHGAQYRRAAATETSLRWELHRRQLYWRRRVEGMVKRALHLEQAA